VRRLVPPPAALQLSSGSFHQQDPALRPRLKGRLPSETAKDVGAALCISTREYAALRSNSGPMLDALAILRATPSKGWTGSTRPAVSLLCDRESPVGLT